MNKCWSLYNGYEKLRIDDLSQDQVNAVLLGISANRMNDWYAWRDGYANWLCILEVPEFYDAANAIKVQSHMQVPPEQSKPGKPVGPPKISRPLPSAVPQQQYDPGTRAGTNGGTNTATLLLEEVQIKERRSARRFLSNLVFQAKVGDSVFSCKTLDISMSGVSLKDKLPPELNEKFRAKLILSGHELKIVAARVTDTSVKIVDSEAWDLLRQWIIVW